MNGHLSGDPHPDYCSCIKPESYWGFAGWHQTERMSRHGETPVVVIWAIEPCPAYRRVVRLNKGEPAAKRNPLLDV